MKIFNQTNLKSTLNLAFKVSMLLALLLVSLGASAQESLIPSALLDASLAPYLITINGLLMVMIFVLLVNLKTITNALRGNEKKEEPAIEQDMFASFGLTDAIPVERESEILLMHDYDGIHELDNNLPPWWKYGFYITTVIAIVYMWYYLIHVDSHTGHNEYVAEMLIAAEEAEARGASVDENTAKLLTSESDLAAGAIIYKSLCVACHLTSGGGSVGPNLTDEYWKHGGGIKNVFRTVKVGVPEKGMIAWESQISPRDIQKVSSYVLSLQGTQPLDGKAPEGDKWTE